MPRLCDRFFFVSFFLSVLVTDLGILFIFLVCNNSNYLFGLMGQKKDETSQRNEKKRSTLNYNEIQRRTKQMKKKGKHTKSLINFFLYPKVKPRNEKWKEFDIKMFMDRKTHKQQTTEQQNLLLFNILFFRS